MAVAHAAPVRLEQSVSHIASPQQQSQQLQPPSPTLTNPDMILPYEYGASILPDSPTGLPQLHLLPQFSSSRYLFSADKVPRRLHDNEDPQLVTPPATSHGDAQTPRGREPSQAFSDISSLPLASSPTLASPSPENRRHTATLDQTQSRRLSLTDSEGSVVSLSEDFVFNYKHLVLDDNDQAIPDDGSSGGDDTLEQSSTAGDQDDVLAASAALSRRAERILASARKRLDNMEDNLTRARSSILVPKNEGLGISEQAYTRSRSESPEDQATTPTAESHFEPLAHDFTMPLHLPEDSSNSTPNNVGIASSPNVGSHLHGVSRSMSVMDHDAAAQQRKVMNRQSLNFSNPFRNSIIRMAPMKELSENSGEIGLSRSQSAAAFPLSPSVESRNRSQSTVATYDIRDHMRDLKDRISNLQEKAKQDNANRRSMQSLRESSISSSKESWYASNNRSSSSLGQLVPKDKSALPNAADRDDMADARSIMTQDVDFEDAQSHIDVGDDDFDETEDFLDEYNDDEDDFMVDASSDQPGERHEDRADAFDYDHLFLHNGVIIARKGSSASIRSDDSTSTTRALELDTGYIVHEVRSDSPVDPLRLSIGLKPELPKRISALSMSTVNTFQTATEGKGSDEDEEDDALAVLDARLGIYSPSPSANVQEPNPFEAVTAVRTDMPPPEYPASASRANEMPPPPRPVSASRAAEIQVPGEQATIDSTSDTITPPTTDNDLSPASDEDWLGAKRSAASSTTALEQMSIPQQSASTFSNHQRMNSMKSVSSKTSISPSLLSDLGGTPKPPFSSKSHAGGDAISSSGAASTRSSSSASSFPQRSFPINPLKASPSPTLSHSSSLLNLAGQPPIFSKPRSGSQPSTRDNSVSGPAGAAAEIAAAGTHASRMSTMTAIGPASSSGHLSAMTALTGERPVSMNSEGLTHNLLPQDKVVVERIVDALAKICWHLEVDASAPSTEGDSDSAKNSIGDYRSRLEQALALLEGLEKTN